MHLSRREKQELAKYGYFFLSLIASSILIIVLTAYMFNVLGSLIGIENAQRIHEAVSIDVPQLLITHYGLSITIILPIVYYLYQKHNRRW